MRTALGRIAAGTSAIVLLAGVTLACLVGLNAECNGGAGECPRSTAYRSTLLASPLVTLAILTAGVVWSVRRRSARPLVLGEACVLVALAVVAVVLGSGGLGTIALLAAAFFIGRAALRR